MGHSNLAVSNIVNARLLFKTNQTASAFASIDKRTLEGPAAPEEHGACNDASFLHLCMASHTADNSDLLIFHFVSVIRL